MITQRRSETAKVADEQAKGWCSKKPICIVGWMMRKRKMDIEHGTKDEHDKTRANNHRETERERDTHTHKYMYVICIDMCCPCNVIYFVHSRAHTHTRIHIWHNCTHADMHSISSMTQLPGEHKLDSFSTFVVWGQALFLFRQASRLVLSVSSILPALWFIQEMELHFPYGFWEVVLCRVFLYP